MPSPHLRVVLLDIDGTLVDSNDFHAHAWLDAFNQAGYDIPFERVRSLIGMGGDKIIPRLTGLDPESDDGKSIEKQRGKIFLAQYLPQIRGFPKSRPLLERMRQEGFKLVIATSAKQEEYESLIRIADVADVVDDKTTSDNVQRSKPDPDIIIAALKKSGYASDEGIMLGDTPYDVQAAQRAGVRCVAFRSGGWTDEDLADALAIYDDPTDLLARFDTSPFAMKLF